MRLAADRAGLMLGDEWNHVHARPAGTPVEPELHQLINFLRRSLAELGYVGSVPVAQPDEVNSLRDAFDRLLKNRNILAVSALEQQPLESGQWVLKEPRELDFTFGTSIVSERCRRLLGGVFDCLPFLHDSYLIYKPAGGGVETPWHQDRVYLPSDFRLRLMTFWVALQPTTTNNSCMWFLAGSHREPLRPHVQTACPGKVPLLAAELSEVELARIQPAPTEEGYATIHTDMTLHFAGANNSDFPRRAWVLDFAVPAYLAERALAGAKVIAVP
jgi:phytanoyl-CoA hydroxylase